MIRSGAQLAVIAANVPVEPDADEARRWLADELAKPVYREAQPTLFDLAAQAIGDWIAALFERAGDAGGAVGLVVIIVLLIALLVVAFIVFGSPRLERRRRIRSLFGSEDARDSDELRRSAEAAARAGDYSTAVEELFRSIARSLDERTVVELTPGTTARGFARMAASALPDAEPGLRSAADDFDAVRYLGRDGSPEQYDRLVALDRELRAATVAARQP